MSYKLGDWLVCCDVCGKEIYASEAKHRWDGFIVCPEDYEQRHPLDFIRVRADRQSVPFSRPETADQFISVPYIDTGDDPYCTIFTRTALADYGTADCATVGNNTLPGL